MDVNAKLSHLKYLLKEQHQIIICRDFSFSSEDNVKFYFVLNSMVSIYCLSKSLQIKIRIVLLTLTK